MVTKYQGETLEYEVEVLNADGTDADLSMCEVAAGLMAGGMVTRITPTITGNIVAVKLQPSVTETMSGKYTIEIKIKDSDSDIEVIRRSSIYIFKSIIPSFDG